MNVRWCVNEKRIVRLCLIITFLYFIVVVLYKKISTSPQISNYRILENYVSKPFSKEAKGILLWNDFFGTSNWGLPTSFLNESYFIDSRCPVTNCFITTNRSLMDATEFHGVVFHVAQPFSFLQSFPSNRIPEQLYVFATMESPAHTKHDLSDENDIYNLTMTYRVDSDIMWAYGYLQDIETGQVVAPNIKPNWRTPSKSFQLDSGIEAMIAGKNRTAAWFVSNCNVISKRDRLVQALQGHIQVDIYGKCGALSCERGSNKCGEKLDHEYKFYLSLENSLCTDYVTEKLFNMLDRNIIPVVYGGADYTRFMPPLSYINVEDFETVTDLAKHLQFLADNPKEYRKYFWWKKYYKRVFLTPFCQLCSILNNPSSREKVQYYQNVREWWFGHSCRMKPKIKF